MGLGYDLVKTRYVDWKIGLGAAYQYTAFISVGTDSRFAQDVAALFSISLDFDLTEGIEFASDCRLQLGITDLGLSTQHLLSTLSVDIWGPLELNVSLAWDRLEQPVANADGSVPKSNDYRLSVGLGIEFCRCLPWGSDRGIITSQWGDEPSSITSKRTPTARRPGDADPRMNRCTNCSGRRAAVRWRRR